MTSPSRATIVIPTFNRAGLLRRAIDSALQQTIPCEVIVCDHGSTDDTPAVVRSYGDKVAYLRREKDHGPFFAWLDGLINASSEYVHITYDDDWIDPTFMERCLDLFNDDCAFVFTAAQVHSSGVAKPLFADLFRTGVHKTRAIEPFLVAKPLTISPGCAVFRKKDVLPAMIIGGLPDAKASYHGAGDDLLMFLFPLMRRTRFGFVNEQLAHFLSHEGSITIDARDDLSKRAALRRAYREAKYHYLALKIGRQLHLGEMLFWWNVIKNRILRTLFHWQQR